MNTNFKFLTSTGYQEIPANLLSCIFIDRTHKGFGLVGSYGNTNTHFSGIFENFETFEDCLSRLHELNREIGYHFVIGRERYLDKLLLAIPKDHFDRKAVIREKDGYYRVIVPLKSGCIVFGNRGEVTMQYTASEEEAKETLEYINNQYLTK